MGKIKDCKLQGLCIEVNAIIGEVSHNNIWLTQCTQCVLKFEFKF